MNDKNEYNKLLTSIAKSSSYSSKLPSIVIDSSLKPSAGEVDFDTDSIKVGNYTNKSQALKLLKHEFEHYKEGPADYTRCKTYEDQLNIQIPREIRAWKAESGGKSTIGTLGRCIVDLVEYRNLRKKDAYYLFTKAAYGESIPRSTITKAIKLARQYMIDTGVV